MYNRNMSETPLQERAQKYFAKERTLQSKYGLRREPQIVFPDHKGTPLRGKLATWLLQSCNAHLIDGVKNQDHASAE